MRIIFAGLAFVTFGLSVVSAQTEAARRIQGRFIAPCCWNESLATHRSEMAGVMRAEIESLVAQGRSEQQIVEHYVARYGEKILLEPRGTTVLWLTWVPVAAAAGAVALLVWLLRRWRLRSQPEPLAAGGVPLAPLDELD